MRCVPRHLCLLLLSVAAASCSSSPNTNSGMNYNTGPRPTAVTPSPVAYATPVSLATPADTVGAFYTALNDRDDQALRRTLSRDSLKVADEILKSKRAKQAGFYTLVSLLSDLSANTRLPEVRGQTINGDRATLEVMSGGSGRWEVLHFSREGGEWKLEQSFK